MQAKPRSSFQLYIYAMLLCCCCMLLGIHFVSNTQSKVSLSETGILTFRLENAGGMGINTVALPYRIFGSSVMADGSILMLFAFESGSVSKPIKRGYTFQGYYCHLDTGSQLQIVLSNGDVSLKNFAANEYNKILTATKLYAHWEKATVEEEAIVQIDPNGGLFNGSSQVQAIRRATGATLSISQPTREGYSFEGWMLESGDASISSFGKLIYQHPFVDSMHLPEHFVYDNKYSGNTTFSFIEPTDDLMLPSQEKILRIRNIGETQPDLGGIYPNLMAKVNALYYQVIYAKVPVGYSLAWASNDFGGPGNKQEFITPSAGTGNWEVYIIKRQSGSDPTQLSNTGHIYLTGGPFGTAANPVDWYIAYMGNYEATGLGVNADRLSEILTVTIGEEHARIRALWREDNWTKHYQKPAGSGTEADPYRVYTPHELAYFAFLTQAANCDAYILQMADIDLAGRNWIPIGSDRFRFCGMYDGQNYQIRNLQVRSTANYQGLFGYISWNYTTDLPTLVQNVHIQSGSVHGGNFVGSITGCIYSADLKNCSSQAEVVGLEKVGGLVGKANNYVEIYASYHSGQVRGNNDIGGIVGYYSAIYDTFAYLRLNRCYHEGEVLGLDRVGGLLGGMNGYGLALHSSMAKGSVKTLQDGQDIGGLVGKVETTNTSTSSLSISDCCFIGDIVSKIVFPVSGFSGSYLGTVEECYAQFNEYKRLSGSSFRNWNYYSSVNDGLPVPNLLFAVSGYQTQSVFSYLKSLGFSERS